MSISKITDVLQDVNQGKMVILVDDGKIDNEGTILMAAQKVDADAINFMAMHARGLICLALSPEVVERLELPLMVRDRDFSGSQPAFTVSIEARQGVTTGISAADRAQTILTAVADDAKPEDLVQPGHIFPIRASRGGVLFHTGHVEASVDLMSLSGLKPAAAICKIMNDEGAMASMPELENLADEHGLRIVTVADIIAYRMKRESVVLKTAEAMVTTPYGEFKAISFWNAMDQQEHLAMVKGELNPEKEILVRVHPICVIGDVFGAHECDCREKLEKSMDMIQREGCGVIIYLQRGVKRLSLAKKLEIISNQSGDRDLEIKKEVFSIPGQLREYGTGAQILMSLGVRKVRTITTTSPKKIVGLEGYGFEIIETVPLILENSPEQG